MIKYFKHFTQIIFLSLVVQFAFAEGHGEEEGSKEFNLVEFAMHHVGDTYDWEFYTKKDGSKAKLSLPRILWNKKEKQLNFYLSTSAALKAGYREEHLYNHDAAHGKLIVPGSSEEFKDLIEKIEENPQGVEAKLYKSELAEMKPFDISLTKNVVLMLIASGLLIWVFVSVAKRYRTNPQSAPKGIQALVEPIIVFVRDDIAKTYIPHHFEKFLPLLLNFFFFILFLNLMGLIPLSGNVTGNIAVTASLALITLLATNFNGKKNYWQHVFWYPGVPIFVKPIMLVVEFVSVFTKPFALMIRLFANITAGHLVVLAFISLIFIFGKMGAAPTAGFGVSIVSILFTLFIDCIEILVALLQAYIFTTLSALFIGQAVETEH